jgi:hypothetical protein
MHVDDVNKLKPFSSAAPSPPWGEGGVRGGVYRDIRYGLTRGLARRAKPDGIPLLIEMATRDPLTLIRQQARYGIADIQDACRLRGEAVPVVTLPEPRPLEELYPPRGLTWKGDDVELTKWIANQQFDAIRPNKQSLGELEAETDELLATTNFRNLNMAQASGANQLMTGRITTLADRVGIRAQGALLQMLDKSQPFAQHLSAKSLGEHGNTDAIPALTAKLDPFAKSANTVGFWWCCEALAQLVSRERKRPEVESAVQALAKHATATNPANTYGPPGMSTGYIAAKALAQIVADPKHAEVERCLRSDNIWLRAGALRGLAEAKATGIEPLLKQAAEPENPAVVRAEAEVWLRRTERK